MSQIYLILFLSNTRHVSDGYSVHHQEFKTTYRNIHVKQILFLLASNLTAVSVHLVGFAIEIYYDARPYERQYNNEHPGSIKDEEIFCHLKW